MMTNAERFNIGKPHAVFTASSIDVILEGGAKNVKRKSLPVLFDLNPQVKGSAKTSRR